MIPMKIPFQNIGIEQPKGNHVVVVINDLILKHPNRPVNSQEVAGITGYTVDFVRKVFYTLLNLHFLKATFQPRHTKCGHIVGSQERSVEIIRDKFANGQYTCFYCAEPVEEYQEIEIQIVFWKPGAPYAER